MAQETLTLRTMNNGGIIEAVDAALAKIAENIAEINTPPAKPRELTLKIRIKPDSQRMFGTAECEVSTKLQPEEAQVVSILMDKVDGRPALVEAYSDTNPGQARFEGTMPAEMRHRSNKSANVTPFRAAAE